MDAQQGSSLVFPMGLFQAAWVLQKRRTRHEEDREGAEPCVNPLVVRVLASPGIGKASEHLANHLGDVA